LVDHLSHIKLPSMHCMPNITLETTNFCGSAR